MKNGYTSIVVLCLTLFVVLSITLSSAAIPGFSTTIVLNEDASIDIDRLVGFCSAGSADPTCIIYEDEYSKQITFKLSDEVNKESGLSVKYSKLDDLYYIYFYDWAFYEGDNSFFEYLPIGLNLLAEYDILTGITVEDINKISEIAAPRSITYFKNEGCGNSFVPIELEKSGWPEEEIAQILQANDNTEEVGWVSSPVGCGYEFRFDDGCPVIEYRIGLTCDVEDENPDLSMIKALSFEKSDVADDKAGIGENSNISYWISLIVIIMGLLGYLFYRNKK